MGLQTELSICIIMVLSLRRSHFLPPAEKNETGGLCGDSSGIFAVQGAGTGGSPVVCRCREGAGTGADGSRRMGWSDSLGRGHRRQIRKRDASISLL